MLWRSRLWLPRQVPRLLLPLLGWLLTAACAVGLWHATRWLLPTLHPLLPLPLLLLPLLLLLLLLLTSSSGGSSSSALSANWVRISSGGASHLPSLLRLALQPLSLLLLPPLHSVSYIAVLRTVCIAAAAVVLVGATALCIKAAATGIGPQATTLLPLLLLLLLLLLLPTRAKAAATVVVAAAACQSPWLCTRSTRHNPASKISARGHHDAILRTASSMVGPRRLTPPLGSALLTCPRSLLMLLLLLLFLLFLLLVIWPPVLVTAAVVAAAALLRPLALGATAARAMRPSLRSTAAAAAAATAALLNAKRHGRLCRGRPTAGAPPCPWTAGR